MRYPALFQVNTRLFLAELSAARGRPTTLDDIPGPWLDALAADGFDIVWLLGVWQTGEAARRVSRSNAAWLDAYRRVLPDLAEADVCGSCFAVREYRVHDDFGGDEALARLRKRLERRGLALLLDFVPNHVAPDHRWVAEHPEYFVAGTEAQLEAEPQNWVRVGSRILAHGRDPFFPGWPDTLQLNYGEPRLLDAMVSELLQVAGRCDGVRCDMAMLVLPEVFERTWGVAASPFWPRAIEAVRRQYPGFVFMAEVYWDLEWTMHRQGFDYAYDKRLYDRLCHGPARAAREHLAADVAFQSRLARFLENHDEPRAAATFPFEKHRAAAVVTYFTPGLRFVHQGQREGKRVHVPVHLARGPAEPCDPALAAFYDGLLAALRDPAFREGAWQLLPCRTAWDGNGTWDDVIAFAWTGPDDRRRLVVVNDADHASQCYVALPWPGRWRFADRLGPAVYDRDGSDMYFDLPAWGYHVFDVL